MGKHSFHILGRRICYSKNKSKNKGKIMCQEMKGMKFFFFYGDTRMNKWIGIIDKVLLWTIVIFHGFIDVFQIKELLINTCAVNESIAELTVFLSVFLLIHLEQLISYFVDVKLNRKKEK